MDDKLKGLLEAYMKEETHESRNDLESMINTIGWRIVENTYLSPSGTFSTEYLLKVALYLYHHLPKLEERRKEQVVAQVEGTGTSKEVKLEERREEQVVAQVEGTGTSKEVELEERWEEEVVAQVEGTGTSKEVELEEKRKVEVVAQVEGNAGVKNEHRYRSPAPYNKTYSSLVKVCDFLTEPGVGSSTNRQKEDGGTTAAKQGTTAAAEQGTAAEKQGTTAAAEQGTAAAE